MSTLSLSLPPAILVTNSSGIEELCLTNVKLPEAFGIDVPPMNIYVGPEDTWRFPFKGFHQKGIIKEYGAHETVAGFKNHHGFDGAPLEDRVSGALDVCYQENLLKYLFAVSCSVDPRSGWFISPLEIMNGKNIEGLTVIANSIFDHQDMLPKGSELVKRLPSGNLGWYNTCTERDMYFQGKKEKEDHMYIVRFIDGSDGWAVNKYTREGGVQPHPTRPIRVEFLPEI